MQLWEEGKNGKAPTRASCFHFSFLIQLIFYHHICKKWPF